MKLPLAVDQTEATVLICKLFIYILKELLDSPVTWIELE